MGHGLRVLWGSGEAWHGSGLYCGGREAPTPTPKHRGGPNTILLTFTLRYSPHTTRRDTDQLLERLDRKAVARYMDNVLAIG
jgi:hypothetical protein